MTTSNNRYSISICWIRKRKRNSRRSKENATKRLNNKWPSMDFCLNLKLIKLGQQRHRFHQVDRMKVSNLLINRQQMVWKAVHRRQSRVQIMTQARRTCNDYKHQLQKACITVPSANSSILATTQTLKICLTMPMTKRNQINNTKAAASLQEGNHSIIHNLPKREEKARTAGNFLRRK